MAENPNPIDRLLDVCERQQAVTEQQQVILDRVLDHLERSERRLQALVDLLSQTNRGHLLGDPRRVEKSDVITSVRIVGSDSDER